MAAIVPEMSADLSADIQKVTVLIQERFVQIHPVFALDRIREIRKGELYS
jgi:hypothetical protein